MKAIDNAKNIQELKDALKPFIGQFATGLSSFTTSKNTMFVDFGEKVDYTWFDKNGYSNSNGSTWSNWVTSVKFQYGLKVIGNSTFRNDMMLSKVEMPDSVVEIQSSAFYSCSLLKSIELSSNLKSIGTAAFFSSGLKSITIPDSVVEIKSSAFANCSNLEYVEIMNSNTTVGSNAFKNCKKAKFKCSEQVKSQIISSSNGSIYENQFN